VSGHTFISYAHQDTRFALQLAEDLRDAGVWVWLDQWHVTETDAWEQITTRAVVGCARFVLVLSPEAASSSNVRRQTLLAVERGKPIVPVLRRACLLPQLLDGNPPVDFTRGRFFHASALTELVQRLEGKSPAQKKRSVSRVVTRSILQRWWLVSLAILGLIGGMALYLRWPTAGAERVIVPENVKPVALTEPVVVPTPEVMAVFNPGSTPVRSTTRAVDRQSMVFVPAGDFLLGSAEADQDATEDEKPQRVIYLDSFWIDETEISNERYKKCVAAGACTETGRLVSRFQAPELPVVGVSWMQAADYCRWVGGRLPTEAEWEKAARGIDGRSYPWGNRFDGTRLNFCDTNCIEDWRDSAVDDGYQYTAPVGSYPAGASPFGALDMSGNVWEWTADWYAPDSYVTVEYRNPTGPPAGQQRVIRGGSWLYRGSNLRTAARHKESPTYRYENIGFRCAMPETE
jgi:formylglycine-generating enzyme required for sulfatase activity